MLCLFSLLMGEYGSLVSKSWKFGVVFFAVKGPGKWHRYNLVTLLGTMMKT